VIELTLLLLRAITLPNSRRRNPPPTSSVQPTVPTASRGARGRRPCLSAHAANAVHTKNSVLLENIDVAGFGG
jgi:hypothetical protein